MADDDVEEAAYVYEISDVVLVQVDTVSVV